MCNPFSAHAQPTIRGINVSLVIRAFYAHFYLCRGSTQTHHATHTPLHAFKRHARACIRTHAILNFCYDTGCVCVCVCRASKRLLRHRVASSPSALRPCSGTPCRTRIAWSRRRPPTRARRPRVQKRSRSSSFSTSRDQRSRSWCPIQRPLPG